MTDPKVPHAPSRRDFLKTAAVGGAVVAPFGLLQHAHAAGNETLKIGLVGCGGRGTGAAENACDASEGVVIHAMGDLFADHLNNARASLKKNEKCQGKFDVADDRCFVGFDAYKKVIDSGVDLVILASPPGFRPQMLEYAIAQGKHVFTEKPVCVDPAGYRKVIKAAAAAKEKGLGVVAGTQRRHQASYLESMKRIHGGELGEITSARCYWNQGGLWKRDRESSWSDMEWQVRNWLYFVWLSGDHIVEQHVHNIDVMNWALDAVPVKAVGLGGRQTRTGAEYGHIFDHFAIDYEYPNGVHVLSEARQIDNTQGNVSEAVVGTKGTWASGPPHRFRVGGKMSAVRDTNKPYVTEHTDLVKSIRAGKPLNELKTVADSCLTAVMGRMAAYTGKEVSWDFLVNESKLDTFPKELSFGKIAVPPVAKPGETELV